MIIAISANRNGAGKDLVGEIINRFLPDYEIKKFASAVNKGFKFKTGVDFLSLSRSVKEQYRKEFIKYAEGFKEVLGEDYWVSLLLSEGLNDCIITDLRFPVEYKALKDYDCLFIHIQRIFEGDKVVWKGKDAEVIQCFDDFCVIKVNGSVYKTNYTELKVEDELTKEFDSKVNYLYNNKPILELMTDIQSILKLTKI